MRNLVSLAVASLLLLPALGARAEGPVSGDKAGPGSPGKASPDRSVRAKPTVTITFARLGGDELDDDFRIQFEWSEKVDGFDRDDIEIKGADPKSTFMETETDSVWTWDIDTDPHLEGKITVTVVANAATSQSTDEYNEKTSAERDVDNKAPDLLKATADVQTIVLVYHERVDRNSDGWPDPADYSVTTKVVDDSKTALSNHPPDRVVLLDETVTLTLATADTVHPGDIVILTYNHWSNPLEDSTGNRAPPFTDTIENLRKITVPGPVQDLTAQVNDTSISLNWDQPADTGGVPILGYRVQGSKDGGSVTTLQSGEGEDHDMTAFLHDTLNAGETWEYTVFALNAAGEGDGEQIRATTTTPEPSPPRNLTATAAGDSAIGLGWDLPADTGSSAITGYKIEVSENGTRWDSLANTAANKTDHEHGNLEAGTTRHYRVFAINGDGTSEHSNIDSATTRSTPPKAPDPPRNLTATAAGDSAIGLGWDLPADTGSSAITGYKIEVSENGTRWDSLANTAANKTDHEHGDLEAGTTRHYRVFAINADGTSEHSNIDSATTRSTPPKAPDPPRNLTATAAGDSAIGLGWDLPADTGSSAITGYKIEVSENGTRWDSLANTAANKTDHEHGNLEAGTTRHYRVFAINGDGTSELEHRQRDHQEYPAQGPRPPQEPHCDGRRRQRHRPGLGPAGRHRVQCDYRLQDRGV